jgi:hypothetical protein
MDFRNAKYSNADNTIIDMEIDHPVYGWIPFSANADDVESLGKEMFDAAVAAGNIAAYVAPIPVVPDRVTANQFGQQMIVAGIKSQVDAWVALQSDAVQWAYARSATFVREDPMMQSGFTALGFTSAQIDQFFIDASKIGAD